MAAPKKKPAKAAKPAAAAVQTRPRAEVPFLGREAERASLAAAVARDVLPQAILFSGTPGVGKQRLAQWLATTLLCQAVTSNGACGTCQSCRLAEGLAHPDLHWMAPHTTPGSGSLEQQLEEIASQLGEIRESIRADALYPGAAVGTMFYLATIHAIRREVYRTSRLGGRKVFVITDADRLMPVAGAVGEAANALLKMLEEPPAGTHFILTTAVPHLLPATIRSRTTRIALPPLPVNTVSAILTSATVEADPALLQSVAEASGGSVRRAREWLTPAWRDRRAQALALVDAASRGDRVTCYAAVRSQGFSQARGDFADLLRHMEEVCWEGAAVTALGAEHGPRVATGALGTGPLMSLEREQEHQGPAALWRAVTGRGIPAEAWADAARAVVDAYLAAQGNGNPQLILHTTLTRMTTAFITATTGTATP